MFWTLTVFFLSLLHGFCCANPTRDLHASVSSYYHLRTKSGYIFGERKWTIHAPKSHYIELNILSMDWDWNGNQQQCQILRITNYASYPWYSNSSIPRPVTNDIRKSDLLKPFASTTDKIDVIATASRTYCFSKGFYIIFKARKVLEKCSNISEVVDVNPGNVLKVSSTNFPEQYQPNQRCVWRLQAPPGFYITVRLNHIALECCCDYVEFRDGKSDADRLLQKVSGHGSSRSSYTYRYSHCSPYRTVLRVTNTSWQERYVKSSGRYLTMIFYSDASVTDRGFLLEVTAGIRAAASYELKPTNYESVDPTRYEPVDPTRYEPVDPTRYESFDPTRYESFDPTRYEWFDPAIDELATMARYPAIRETGYFPTGTYQKENCPTSGEVVDVNPGNALRVSSVNYPEQYLSNQRCVWRFQAPPGYYIKVQLNDIAVECCCDYVEFRDGKSDTDRLLQKVGGREFTPSPYTGRYSHCSPYPTGFRVATDTSWQEQYVKSSGRYLTIIFYSDGSVTDRGFLLEVTADKRATGYFPTGTYQKEYSDQDWVWIATPVLSALGLVLVAALLTLRCLEKRKKQENRKVRFQHLINDDAEEPSFVTFRDRSLFVA